MGTKRELSVDVSDSPQKRTKIEEGERENEEGDYEAKFVEHRSKLELVISGVEKDLGTVRTSLSFFSSTPPSAISKSLLQETKIVPTLNILRKSKAIENEETIKSEIKKMLCNWKEIVAKMPSTPKADRKPPTPSSPQNYSTPTTPKATKDPSPGNNSNDESRFEYEKCGEKVRDFVRGKFMEVFAEVEREREREREKGREGESGGVVELGKLVVELETRILEEHEGQANANYKQRFRTLVSALRNPKNPELKRNVVEGIITASELAGFTHEQLMSTTELEQKRRIEKFHMDAARTDWEDPATVVTTDIFKCGKCKQRKCKYTQAQTRSADEPMTTFICCMVCGNRWRE